MPFDLKNQKHDGRSSAKTSDDISTNRRNESQTSTEHATLLFGKRTERIKVIYYKKGMVCIFYMHSVVGNLLRNIKRQIWRRDSQNPPLQRRTNTYTKNTLE